MIATAKGMNVGWFPMRRGRGGNAALDLGPAAAFLVDEGLYQNVTDAVMFYVGDSLTLGTGSTGNNTYPNQLQTLLGLTSPAPNVYAANGFTVTEMEAGAPESVDPTYSATANKPQVVILWGGINDVAAGDTAQAIYDDIVDFCEARQAVGWSVIVLTLIPATNLSVPQEMVRVAVNVLLLADFPTTVSGLTRSGGAYANYLVNVNGDVRIDMNNPLISGDGVHLTNLGYSYIAEDVAVAANQLGVGAPLGGASANNDPIGRWLDASGNGRFIGSPQTDWRPLLKTGIQNGLPMVLFDGSNDRLIFHTNLTLGTSYTAMCVLRFTSLSTQVTLGAANPGQYVMAWDSGGSTTFFSWDFSGSLISIASVGLSLNTVYLLTLRRSGTTVQLFKNGTQVGTDQTLGANGSMIVGRFGRHQNDTLPQNGHMGDTYLFTSALSTTDRQTAEAAIMTRWGL